MDDSKHCASPEILRARKVARGQLIGIGTDLYEVLSTKPLRVRGPRGVIALSRKSRGFVTVEELFAKLQAVEAVPTSPHSRYSAPDIRAYIQAARSKAGAA